MMTFADCLSCLAFFMELGEDHVGGAFPDTLEDSVYRMKKFIFYLFFCFSSYLYIHCHTYHYASYMSLAMAEPLYQSPLFYLRGFGAPM